ncbi:cholinesterase 2-like [Oppia nitens]|uniref:cholinesterase 2-like n=1 Tax=Oppia nitens TaxID=1686743 RepID=UPI0023DA0F9E|nr:cholinesterase 2-like [Oppia nitens]
MNITIFIVLYLVHQTVCTDSRPLVTTSSGVVRGQTLYLNNKKIDQYLNIPFAEPPVGRLRFAKPVPLKTPQNEIINGIYPGNSCIQDIIGNQKPLTESEDCLVLNVWSPNMNSTNDTTLKPVMFWIYGGGLSMGSIFQETFNGTVLATYDMVIVAANYRVGALGFLYGADDSAPGNLGFYDQLLALQWLRDNVHVFVGDRDLITIFGQSAGSTSIAAHILSPLSNGLFKRAIMQSGSLLFNKDRPLLDTTDALKRFKQMARQLDCDPYDYRWLDCLRDIPDPKLFCNKPHNYSALPFNFPVIGTEFLPQLPLKSFSLASLNIDIDLMAGTTTDEGPGLLLGSYTESKSHMNRQLFDKLLNEMDNDFHNLEIDKLLTHYLNNANNSINDSNNLLNALGTLYGDLLMVCPTYLFTKLLSMVQNYGKNVYYYRFDYKSDKMDNPWKILEKYMGLNGSLIHHSSDLDFVFGTPIIKQQDFSELDYDFSLEVMKMWTDFAKYGKPSNDWPKFLDTTVGDDNQLVSKIKVLTPYDLTRVEENPFLSTCDGVWKQYFL